jgi:hypothetical protein
MHNRSELIRSIWDNCNELDVNYLSPLTGQIFYPGDKPTNDEVVIPDKRVTMNAKRGRNGGGTDGNQSINDFISRGMQ